MAGFINRNKTIDDQKHRNDKNKKDETLALAEKLR